MTGTVDLFTLTTAEQCALARLLDRQYIPYDGTTGPIVHAMLVRLREHVGPDRYREFTAGEWPEELR